MKTRGFKFALKTVTEKTVSKAMRRMKKKKSAGSDGIRQDIMLLGEMALITPLTNLINTAIATGVFSDERSHCDTITEKKGSSTDKTIIKVNYLSE